MREMADRSIQLVVTSPPSIFLLAALTKIYLADGLLYIILEAILMGSGTRIERRRKK